MTTLRRRLRAILPTLPHRHRAIEAKTEMIRVGESGNGWLHERCACKLRRVRWVEAGLVRWESEWGTPTQNRDELFRRGGPD